VCVSLGVQDTPLSLGFLSRIAGIYTPSFCVNVFLSFLPSFAELLAVRGTVMTIMDYVDACMVWEAACNLLTICICISTWLHIDNMKFIFPSHIYFDTVSLLSLSPYLGHNHSVVAIDGDPCEKDPGTAWIL
jgi:hypothetical protein